MVSKAKYTVFSVTFHERKKYMNIILITRTGIITKYKSTKIVITKILSMFTLHLSAVQFDVLELYYL